jgi:hypothetical protein
MNFVNSDSTIDAVCLATYNVTEKEYFSNNHWYGLKRENDFQRLEAHNALVPIGKYVTNKKLLKWKSDKKQFVAHFVDELDDEYDKIFMCGKAFDICVTRRPIGIYNLMKNKKSKVCVKLNCVLTSDGIFPDLSKDPFWKHLKDNIYECLEVNKNIKPWEY